MVILCAGRAFGQSDDLSRDWQNVNGLKIFYRPAGNRRDPAIVLPHEHPGSSSIN